MQSSLVTLCKDKYGSRVVDVLWRQSVVQRKQELAEQLIAHEDELLTSYYGKIILRNCNISHYKNKQAAWQDVERAAERKRELFEDILGDKAPVESKQGSERVKVGGKKPRRRSQKEYDLEQTGGSKVMRYT